MQRTLFNPAWYPRRTDDLCPRTAKACVHLPLHQQGQFPLTAAFSCFVELGPLHTCTPHTCNLDHHSLISFVFRSGVIFIAFHSNPFQRADPDKPAKTKLQLTLELLNGETISELGACVQTGSSLMETSVLQLC